MDHGPLHQIVRCHLGGRRFCQRVTVAYANIPIGIPRKTSIRTADINIWCGGKIENTDWGSHAGASHINPNPTMFPLIPRQRLAASVQEPAAVTRTAVPTPVSVANFEELFTDDI
jgi:hypothetical protein